MKTAAEQEKKAAYQILEKSSEAIIIFFNKLI